MPTLNDIPGLWRRSLILWPNGERDQTTSVFWLQGPSLYADLRLSASRPSFEGVRCLRDLGREHVDWLAAQNGFAGQISFDGSYFEWHRIIDLHPSSGQPDVGRFWFEGDVMIEEGRDIPYIEHWHRGTPVAAACAAVLMNELTTGRRAVIVRVGDVFMIARDRRVPVSGCTTLANCIAETQDINAAQDLVDCEVSFGNVETAGWRITHSTLPWREGNCLQPQRKSFPGGFGLRIGDISAEGHSVMRNWVVETVQGSLADLMGDSGDASAA